MWFFACCMSPSAYLPVTMCRQQSPELGGCMRSSTMLTFHRSFNSKGNVNPKIASVFASQTAICGGCVRTRGTRLFLPQQGSITFNIPQEDREKREDRMAFRQDKPKRQLSPFGPDIGVTVPNVSYPRVATWLLLYLATFKNL